VSPFTGLKVRQFLLLEQLYSNEYVLDVIRQGVFSCTIASFSIHSFVKVAVPSIPATATFPMDILSIRR
jgi:hypothetical protein